MRAVNAISQFFAKKMAEIEAMSEGGLNLVDVIEHATETAMKMGASAEEAEIVAKQGAKMAVAVNMVSMLREVMSVLRRAGRVAAETGAPELVVEAGQELMSPEKMKTEARQAAGGLGMVIEFFNDVLPLLQKEADLDDVVDGIVADGRNRREQQAKKAEPEVTAKPVSGAVIPFGKKVEPSSN